MGNSSYLVLGGAGLVGVQVCRQIAHQLRPAQVVVASRWKRESEEAVAMLRRELSEVEFVPEWGDLFIPSHLANLKQPELLDSARHRADLVQALYGDFDAAYRDNHLVRMIQRYRPEVVIDCVNTATAISYKDLVDAVAKVRDQLTDSGLPASARRSLEELFLSQSAPQIVRHVSFLYRATVEVGTRVLLKVGTTGTGGMGLNIPYTHGEDKPSQKLMSKTEVGFGQTGLLFLMGRTPGAPVVKEIKPAAMIGYRRVAFGPIRDRRTQANAAFYEPRRLRLDQLEAIHPVEATEEYQRGEDLLTTVVDTGENGVFTRGEFAAITAVGQMEFVTPEEVAEAVVHELRGANTGKDVVSALDGSVLGPTYRAGSLRRSALRTAAEMEEKRGAPSIALGQLGPPELSKLLFEVYLLKRCYGQSARAILEVETADGGRRPRTAAELATDLERLVRGDGAAVASMACSVGIPILLPDGVTLIRGPKMNIPELLGLTRSAALGPERIDAWARKGWVDLRATNMEQWLRRFDEMIRAGQRELLDGSAAFDRRSCSDEIGEEIGDIVAWVFNNEMGGYRIK